MHASNWKEKRLEVNNKINKITKLKIIKSILSTLLEMNSP